MINKDVCLAPWFSLYVGKLAVKPCCLWTGNNKWETIEDIEKIWNSEWMQNARKDFLNGKIPNSCKSCYQRIQSRNDWLSDRIGDLVDRSKMDIVSPIKPLQVDFHLGNKCNLQCKMCASWASRNWYDFEKKLNSIDKNFDRYPIKKYDMDVSIFKNSKEMFSKTIRFDFKGGEPMLYDSMVEMIENLVSWGYAKNMALSYVTNASTINKDAMKLWKHFKEVRLVVSIDGTDDMFSYVRGLDFEKLKETVSIYDKIENVKGLHNVAVSIYNILDVSKLNDWMINRDLNRFPCKKSGSIYHFTCNVIKPNYLDPRILPKKYKKLILKQFENGYSKNLTGIVEWVKSIQDIPEDKKQLKLFVTFTKEFDKMNGTDFLSLKPEFEELFKEYA